MVEKENPNLSIDPEEVKDSHVMKEEFEEL